MIGGESIMARNLIITGMSGAGKTQVMRTLEDLGYFCVDNLPPTFIPKFIELCMKRSDESDQLALAADIRGGKFFDELTEVLDQLSREKIPLNWFSLTLMTRLWCAVTRKRAVVILLLERAA